MTPERVRHCCDPPPVGAGVPGKILEDKRSGPQVQQGWGYFSCESPTLCKTKDEAPA